MSAKPRKIEINEAVARKVLTLVDAGLAQGVGYPVPGEMCVEAAVCFALGLPHGDDPKCVAPSLRLLKIRLNDSNWSSNEARAKGLRRLAVAQLGSAGVLDEEDFRKRLVDHALRVSTPKALRAAASVQKDAEHRQKLLDAAARCEKEGTREAALAGRDAADAADAAANAANAARAAANAARAADAAANAAYAAAAAANAARAADAAASAAAAAANAANAARAAASAADAANAADKSLAEYAEAVVQMLIEMNVPGCQWLPLTEAA